MHLRKFIIHSFNTITARDEYVLKTVLVQKKILLFSILFLVVFVKSLGQTGPLPKNFYTYKTNGEKAVYLKKVIADSISANALTNVPFWCHVALLIASKMPNDTITPWLYQYLGDAYDRKKNDSAAFYFRKSLSAFKNINVVKKIYLQQSLLYAYIVQDNKDSIRNYINQLELTIASLPDTNRRKLNAANSISQGYTALNKYELTIKYLRFVIENALKIKDTGTLLNAFVNAGTAYNQTGNNRQAIYYTLQALPYLGDDPYSKMVTYANLADYYSSFKNIDSAKIFLVKAEELANTSKDEDAINSVALQRASVLILEKKYDAAEPILKKSLTFYEKQPPGTSLVNCLLIYAALDTALNNYDKAEKHLLTLYKVTKAMDFKAYTVENLRMLAFVNEQLGDYKDAYNYQKEFIAINDSIKTDKAEQSLAELQTQYQTLKKEEQINILQKESLIKDLELKASERNKTLFIILGGILLTTLLLILYIRNLRNKAALQTIKSSLEMKALRSQMNPHFIFNSLNSIQKYIWENRKEDASEYLIKFARLIRLVLENSMHSSIKLSEELAALRIYIEMEHRRNNQKFDYSITVNDNVDEEKTYIPPLLLQPYVENAIWHGLSQKEERGKLAIAIERKENSLVCIIDDDGIGRTRAAEIKSNTLPKTSLAMNISSQRIAWLQKDTGFAASVVIRDKYTGSTAEGTSVFLTLPIIEIKN